MRWECGISVPYSFASRLQKLEFCWLKTAFVKYFEIQLFDESITLSVSSLNTGSGGCHAKLLSAAILAASKRSVPIRHSPPIATAEYRLNHWRPFSSWTSMLYLTFVYLCYLQKHRFIATVGCKKCVELFGLQNRPQFYSVWIRQQTCWKISDLRQELVIRLEIAMSKGDHGEWVMIGVHFMASFSV